MPEDATAATAERAWPRLVVFFVALPEPLPVSHGSTYSKMFDELIPEWAETEVKVTSDGPILKEAGGRQFVSLKFWQVREPPPQTDRIIQTSVSRVVDTVLGVTRDDSDLPPDLAPEEEHYRTVVEMVTAVTRDPAWAVDSPVEERGSAADPFTRCLAFLQDVYRTYRLSEGAYVVEPTYQRVPAFIPYVWRDIEEGSFSGPSVLVLSHFNAPDVPAPDQMDDQQHKRMGLFASRLLVGDPVSIFAERALLAWTAYARNGEYGEAVIQAALSVEVLLDGVLGLLLWETTLRSPDHAVAASVMALPLARKVKSEFHLHLGGTWDTGKDGPMRAWSIDVAQVRGRVLHRGYRPSAAEAACALEVAAKVEDFIKERLAARVKTYPRTALLVLGEPGLRRLGAWDKVRKFARDEGAGEPSWVHGYRDWRARVDALLQA